MISVAMTTYNGERFIEKQLFSIYNQSRKPDEVVICDDGSKDDTIKIVTEFIAVHALTNWILMQNSTNLGFVNNFLQTVERTNGDIIFFADQDDIWCTDKIEKMAAIMEENPSILSLCGEYTLINENDVPIKNKIVHKTKSRFTGKIRKIDIGEIIGISLYRGCAMCICKKIVPYLRVVDPRKNGHDWLVNVIAAISAGAYELDYPVIKYRVYTDNTSGAGSAVRLGWTLKSRTDYFATETPNHLDNLFPVVSKLANSSSEKLEDILQIERAIDFKKLRLKFLTNRGFFSWIALIQYLGWYRGISEYIGDFAYAYHLDIVLKKILKK